MPSDRLAALPKVMPRSRFREGFEWRHSNTHLKRLDCHFMHVPLLPLLSRSSECIIWIAIESERKKIFIGLQFEIDLRYLSLSSRLIETLTGNFDLKLKCRSLWFGVQILDSKQPLTAAGRLRERTWIKKLSLILIWESQIRVVAVLGAKIIKF